MLSRALSLATVTLLIGCLTAGVARAAKNLDAGKSPSQIFSNTCSACHKSPRGLLKNVSASSLPGFLRQHYTTGTDMASVLSSYLISNGAADPRYQGKDQQKQAKDAKQDGRPDQPDRIGRRQPPAAPAQEATRPEAAGETPQGEGARRAEQAARRQATPEANPPTGRPRCRPRPTASRAAGRSRAGVAGPSWKSRRKPSRRPAAMPRRKVRLGMPPSRKLPTTGALTRLKRQDRSRADRRAQGPRATSRPARRRSPPANPAREGISDTAKVDAAKENVGSEPTPLRPDPVPPVTRRRQIPQRSRLSPPQGLPPQRLHR